MNVLNRMFLSALTLGVILTGCNQQTSEGNGGEMGGTSGTSATAANAGASGKTYKLAFVTNNAADFWTAARAGC